MNVLLLGSGGREHALAWKMRQSKELNKLYIAPGNAGTAAIGTNILLKVTDFDGIKKFSLDNDIDMVVVGPEDPLVQEFTITFKKTKIFVILLSLALPRGSTIGRKQRFCKGIYDASRHSYGKTQNHYVGECRRR